MCLYILLYISVTYYTLSRLRLHSPTFLPVLKTASMVLIKSKKAGRKASFFKYFRNNEAEMA